MSVYVLLFITLCPIQFCDHLEKEEKAGCFAIIVLQMNFYYKCCVALPHGAVGWSAVCDCGIYFLIILTYLCIYLTNLYKEIGWGTLSKIRSNHKLTLLYT